MDKTLSKALVQLGCNPKHIRFYKANLELGAVPLVTIMTRARLSRSTAYVIAKEIVGLGLVNEDYKNYRKLYTAVDPEVLMRLLEAKHRQLGRTQLAFREILPELQAVHQTMVTRPRVRTFEGKTGLLAIMKDILADTQEVLLWTNQASERAIFEPALHEAFVSERISKKIPVRVLAVANSDAEQLVIQDTTSLRETRLLPPELTFTSETYIYGNKVAVVDVGRNIFGVVTENAQIAASQRAVFELVWQQRQGITSLPQ